MTRMKLLLPLACMASLAMVTSGCARTRVLKEAVPVAAAAPVAAADASLQLTLQHVIVRDGPGSWSKRAMWDEYVVQVRNLGDVPLSVEQVVIYDSFGHRVEQQFDLRALARASKQSLTLHRGQGLAVKPGAAPGLYIAGGAVVATYGAAAATLGSALGTSSSLVAAGVGIATGGATLLVVGVDRIVQKKRINRQLGERAFGAAAMLAPQQDKSGSLFFPIVPAPQRIAVVYRTPAGSRETSIDLTRVLTGLHLDPAATVQR
jgi:hypothetical protein